MILQPRLFALMAILPSLSLAQGPPAPVGPAPASCAQIWQGFDQRWGYNHRIHRLADEVVTRQDSACTFQTFHAAASGSGADSASYTQYFTRVEAPGVGFYPLSHTFIMEGREGEEIQAVEELSFFHPDLADPSASFAVLLAGIDLHTAAGGAPDKLMALELSVDTTWAIPSTQTLQVRLRARLRMACSTGECPKLDQGMRYELRAPLLVVVGGDFTVRDMALGASHSWKRDSLPAPEPDTAFVAVDPGMFLPVVGITRLSVDLDGEHHMLGFHAWIEALAADRGLIPVRHLLAFEEGGPGMKEAYKARYKGWPRLPAGWVLRCKGGSAVWEMGLACLQFRAGEAKAGRESGMVGWYTRHGKIPEATGQ